MVSALRVVAVAAALAVAATTAAAQAHPCAKYPTCSTCVASPLCGWCSEPVLYPGNVTGAQCAGFNPNGPDPFRCDAIFSTEQCTTGYTCNMVNFTCDLGKPGTGKTKEACEADCVNKGQVFLCNHTSKKCHQVPKGTAGAASLAACEASCAHPSPHPAPPPPTPHPHLYECNHTAGQCVKAPPGKGASKEVCEAQCKKVNPDANYICNTAEKKCFKLPTGVPGGEPLKKCEEACLPHPQPGPPPALLGGMYRGIQIQKGYKAGEFDMKVSQTEVVFADINQPSESWKGEPYHIENSDAHEMWVKLPSGQYLKTISVMGNPGPETKFMATAMAAPGAVAPSSVKAAMTMESQAVYSFARCQTPQCHFALPSGRKFRRSALGLLRDDEAGPAALPAEEVDRKAQSFKSEVGTTKVNPKDHCSAHDASCAECLSHQYCGWCSVNVTYLDSTGTQCAGFPTEGHEGARWKCNGHYSTFNCTAGYKCDETNFQCVETAPGNGYPKEECEQLCKPTPAPTPAPPQAVCNLTTKQCHPCPDHKKSCTGSQPLPACESACAHHKKGPHANLIGIWRGLLIQVGYRRIEVEFVLNKTAGAVYHNKVLQYTAAIDSLGSDAMLWTIKDGQYKGFKFGTKYQVATQPGSFFDTITLAAGKFNGAMPGDFASAMTAAGEREYVFVKCSGEPCQFQKP